MLNNLHTGPAIITVRNKIEEENWFVVFSIIYVLVLAVAINVFTSQLSKTWGSLLSKAYLQPSHHQHPSCLHGDLANSPGS